MIRIVLAFFATAVVVCAAIVFAPAGNNDDPAQTDVTRTQSQTVTSPTLAPAIAGQNTSDGVAVSAASRILAATGGAVQPEPAIKTDDSSISDTTAGVLAALGLATGAPAPTPTSTTGDDKMMDMTAGALAGIRAITGQPAPQQAESNSLQSLVAKALQEGQNDAYIDALLNEAAQAGDVSVPAMLVTSDGRVDTSTLLASIVQQATTMTTGQAPAAPTTPLGAADGVEVRVVQRAGETEQYKFYTVAAGDSLGSIAVKFYGSVEFFPRIFEANRQILSSPDRIQAGQRLVIP
ncbi:hypothetical protein BVC71_08515 [Marivivens niveibacter]|uniref:LysM domain-containing protein n=1 Tax=Marivivens niveibacter TaxID=1930667 RepID=A0A251X0E2_9RHOB|nr:LysM peptidoglycan-binding domain-containing protein [Marivivens niveibacter]OUD09855.1 hypothetical protein BVC71_08515 [Marivivens niveibacter]